MFGHHEDETSGFLEVAEGIFVPVDVEDEVTIPRVVDSEGKLVGTVMRYHFLKVGEGSLKIRKIGR